MNDPKKRKPQMLWNFALSCVISDIREKKKTWTWNYITQNKKYRQQYVTLYKKKKKLGEDKVSFSSLTSSFSYTLFLTHFHSSSLISFSFFSLTTTRHFKMFICLICAYYPFIAYQGRKGSTGNYGGRTQL